MFRDVCRRGKSYALAVRSISNEKERAARFRFAQHREAFITARGCLRLLLSRYIGELLRKSGLYTVPRAKHHAPNPRSISILSHSAGLAVFAFTRAGDIGWTSSGYARLVR